LLAGGIKEAEFCRLRPLSYPHTDLILMLFSIESNVTLQNCIEYWEPEVSHHCPGVPIVLVGVSHCYHAEFGDQPPSNSSVSEEEGKETAKKIGKTII